MDAGRRDAIDRVAQYHCPWRPVLIFRHPLTNTDPNAKAGGMFRADTTAAAAFAALVATAANSVTFEWRPTAGAQVQQEVASPPGGPVLAPVGLKLTRAGNAFTPYYSTDGINWIQLGPS